MADDDEVRLFERLFPPPQRLGWKYVPVAPARRSPIADKRPTWTEPTPWNAEPLKRKLQSLQGPWTVGLVVLLLFFLPIAFAPHGVGLAIYGCLVAAGVVSLVGARRATSDKIRRLEANSRATRESKHAQYRAEDARWFRDVENWNAGERARVRDTPTWYPVAVNTRHIDVFGGTPDGWAALLCTLGASILGSSRQMFVLDLTDAGVAADLAVLAKATGHPVSERTAPQDLSVTDMLRGLGKDDVAEVLAEVFASARGSGGRDAGAQALDADLLREVAGVVGEDLSVERLAAGVQVLEQVYDPGAAAPVLSPEELAALTRKVDLIGRGERVQIELQNVRSGLTLLARVDGRVENFQLAGQLVAGDGLHGVDLPAQAPVAPREQTLADGSAPRALTITRVGERNRRRKDLIDRLLVELLVHRLDQEGPNGFPEDAVVVVAGVDELSRSTLETLGRRGRRARVQLVLLSEHLRGDLREFLGVRDGATIVMRLGNASEAAAASEFIGRGHSFVLTQLSRQYGENHAKATGVSQGDTRSHTSGAASSTTVGWSEQRSTNWTVGWSSMQGQVETRVYEFVVEPAQIQELHPTAGIFVTPAPTGREVVTVDCNPRIVALDKVSAVPR